MQIFSIMNVYKQFEIFYNVTVINRIPKFYLEKKVLF